jgi:hypothetical protein
MHEHEKADRIALVAAAVVVVVVVVVVDFVDVMTTVWYWSALDEQVEIHFSNHYYDDSWMNVDDRESPDNVL